MSVLSPPQKPVRLPKSDRKEKSAYTINHTHNKLYGVRPSDKSMKISIVSFSNVNHAQKMSVMIEEYRRRTGEWPDFMNDHSDNLFLPDDANNKKLIELSIVKWDLDELKMCCMNNMLDLITLNYMKKTLDGFSVGGDTYLINGPLEFYQERFSELYHLDFPA
jgi:hypothetical protein